MAAKALSPLSSPIEAATDNHSRGCSRYLEGSVRCDCSAGPRGGARIRNRLSAPVADRPSRLLRPRRADARRSRFCAGPQLLLVAVFVFMPSFTTPCRRGRCSAAPPGARERAGPASQLQGPDPRHVASARHSAYANDSTAAPRPRLLRGVCGLATQPPAAAALHRPEHLLPDPPLPYLPPLQEPRSCRAIVPTVHTGGTR